MTAVSTLIIQTHQAKTGPKRGQFWVKIHTIDKTLIWAGSHHPTESAAIRQALAFLARFTD